jgi:hypothetical protein
MFGSKYHYHSNDNAITNSNDYLFINKLLYLNKYWSNTNVDWFRRIYGRDIQRYSGRLNNKCNYRSDNTEYKYSGSLYSKLHACSSRGMSTSSSDFSNNDYSAANGNDKLC